MKDKPQDPDIHDLHPCPFSIHCFRLVDDLDGESDTHHSRTDDLADDEQDELFLKELRAHIPTCPTCTTALEQARTARLQQRHMLQSLLAQGEQQVPSMAQSIFSALREEQRTQPLWLVEMNNHHKYTPRTLVPLELPLAKASAEAEADGPVSSPLPIVLQPGTHAARERHTQPPIRPHRTRRTLRSVISLVAAAAILFATLAAVTSLVWLRHVPSTAHQPHLLTAPTTIATSPDWNGLVVTSVQQNQLSITLYDPTSGQSALVARIPATQSAFDGVSHDGLKLLYHVYDGKTTSYHLWHLETDHTSNDDVLYTYTGNSGAALFRNADNKSPYDQFIFISTPSGVEQVDITNGASTTLLPALVAPILQFYRDGYLYFLTSNLPARLERVNVNNGRVQTITPCPLASAPWMSTGGATIYYVCDGSQDLNAMNPDGTKQHVQRAQAGSIVGYADDNQSILALVPNTAGTFTLVKYGRDATQDQVLLQDIAPGAQHVSQANVAVAPYGHWLVAKGTYASGESKTWYSDITEGTTHLLTIPGDPASLDLPGWAKLHIPSESSAPPTGPARAYSNWHGVVTVITNQQTGLAEIASYDTHTGAMRLLTTNVLPANTTVDGVSPDGLNILYHYPSAGKTLYWTLTPFANTGYFYAQNDGDAGNAIWMPDNRNVLIATQTHGVIEVDITTGAVTSFLSTLKTGKLITFRDPYLYFVGAGDVVTGALYRVLITAGDQPQRVTDSSPGSTFWLSPDGSTAYYLNRGPSGNFGIYATGSDGSQLSLLFTDGRPIGFTDNNALLMIREVKGVFRIVSLNAGQTQDQTVFNDIAPAATALCDIQPPVGILPLCDQSIALSPAGNALVVEAINPNGEHVLFSLDLQTGKRVTLPSAAGKPDVQVQLIGWDDLAN